MALLYVPFEPDVQDFVQVYVGQHLGNDPALLPPDPAFSHFPISRFTTPSRILWLRISRR